MTDEQVKQLDSVLKAQDTQMVTLFEHLERQDTVNPDILTFFAMQNTLIAGAFCMIEELFRRLDGKQSDR